MSVHICVSLCASVYAYVRVCMYARVRERVCTCMYYYVHVSVCMHTHSCLTVYVSPNICMCPVAVRRGGGGGAGGKLKCIVMLLDGERAYCVQLGEECESVYVTCMRRVYLWMGKGRKHVMYILFIRSLSLCTQCQQHRVVGLPYTH